MVNIEYEYSFKVRDITPFITYCDKNGYIKISENKEIREMYRNLAGSLARKTTKIIDNKNQKELDFKEDDCSSKILKERKETLPLKYKSDEEIDSILEFHGYKYYKTLNRTRIVYEKNKVTFELDTYYSPEKMFVVALEGSKEETNQIYKELINKFKEYIIK